MIFYVFLLQDKAEILEFIEEIQHPNVIRITYNSFHQVVKGSGHLWTIDFFTPWCRPCQQIAGMWRKLAKSVANDGDGFVGTCCWHICVSPLL